MENREIQVRYFSNKKEDNMFFRIYILLILASFITLFTRCWIVGAAGILFLLILWPLAITSNYKKWKKSQSHIQKNLSFGFKSMKRQKHNFKAINFVFSRSPSLQNFLKKVSIVLDDMHMKFTSKHSSINHEIIQSSEAYYTDPSYRMYSSNIYNRDR